MTLEITLINGEKIEIDTETTTKLSKLDFKRLDNFYLLTTRDEVVINPANILYVRRRA